MRRQRGTRLPVVCYRTTCLSLLLLFGEYAWSGYHAIAHADLLPLYVAGTGTLRHKVLEKHVAKKAGSKPK